MVAFHEFAAKAELPVYYFFIFTLESAYIKCRAASPAARRRRRKSFDMTELRRAAATSLCVAEARDA